MGRSGENNLVGNLPLSQALCLPVSAEEIIETCQMAQPSVDDVEQVIIFLFIFRPKRSEGPSSSRVCAVILIVKYLESCDSNFFEDTHHCLCNDISVLQKLLNHFISKLDKVKLIKFYCKN